MIRRQNKNIAPFLSVTIIIVALFSLVFLQMEVRRMGYVFLKQTREFKSLQDRHRLKVMQYAKIMRPERLHDLAVTQLTLNDVTSGQIIHMSGQKIALRQ